MRTRRENAAIAATGILIARWPMRAGWADLAQAKALAGVNAASAKEAHAALLGVLLEAARFDIDVAALACVRIARPESPRCRCALTFAAWMNRVFVRSTLLEDNKLSAGRAQAVAQTYAKLRSDARAQLARTAYTYPHITGVKWRLDYYVKVRARRLAHTRTRAMKRLRELFPPRSPFPPGSPCTNTHTPPCSRRRTTMSTRSTSPSTW